MQQIKHTFTHTYSWFPLSLHHRIRSIGSRITPLVRVSSRWEISWQTKTETGGREWESGLGNGGRISPAANASGANKWKPLECVGYCSARQVKVLNSVTAWIKQYGYAVPSSCLLCFKCTPNSPDGSLGWAVLMCRVFGGRVSAWWRSETADVHTSRCAWFS